MRYLHVFETTSTNMYNDVVMLSKSYEKIEHIKLYLRYVFAISKVLRG